MELRRPGNHDAVVRSSAHAAPQTRQLAFQDGVPEARCFALALRRELVCRVLCCRHSDDRDTPKNEDEQSEEAAARAISQFRALKLRGDIAW